jgi:hypothetical protein
MCRAHDTVVSTYCSSRQLSCQSAQQAGHLQVSNNVNQVESVSDKAQQKLRHTHNFLSRYGLITTPEIDN